MVLSDNSLDHGLVALGALVAGVPIAPVSIAYSLLSQDHANPPLEAFCPSNRG